MIDYKKLDYVINILNDNYNENGVVIGYFIHDKFVGVYFHNVSQSIKSSLKISFLDLSVMGVIDLYNLSTQRLKEVMAK